MKGNFKLYWMVFKTKTFEQLKANKKVTRTISIGGKPNDWCYIFLMAIYSYSIDTENKWETRSIDILSFEEFIWVKLFIDNSFICFKSKSKPEKC